MESTKEEEVITYLRKLERPVMMDGQLFIYRHWYMMMRNHQDKEVSYLASIEDQLVEDLTNRTLSSVLKEACSHQADCVFVAFDSKNDLFDFRELGISSKKDKSSSYKSTHAEGEDTELTSFKHKCIRRVEEDLHKILNDLGVVSLGFKGIEADDFSGLVCKPGLFQPGIYGLLVSNDNDWKLAIRNTDWSMFLPTQKQVYDWDNSVENSFDVSSESSIVMANLLSQKSLVGDKSDSIDPICLYNKGKKTNMTPMKAKFLSHVFYDRSGNFDESLLETGLTKEVLERKAKYNRLFSKDEKVIRKYFKYGAMFTIEDIKIVKEHWDLIDLSWIFRERCESMDEDVYVLLTYQLFDRLYKALLSRKFFTGYPFVYEPLSQFNERSTRAKWKKLRSQTDDLGFLS